MLKLIFFIAFVISALLGSSMSTKIDCSFSSSNWNVVGYIYSCAVNTNPNIITDESAIISEVSGNHESSKTHNDVLGFHASSKTIQIFPKELQNIFKNIKCIQFDSCKLKEVHQTDLKSFPHLVNFYLSGNDIEVIEEGLFDYNPNLELVGFREPKLIHIDANVFDNLCKLSYFYLSSVPCVEKDIQNSKQEVLNVIKSVKSNCQNSNFLSLEDQLNSLKNDSNHSDLKSKLENIEKNVENQKFLKFRPLSSILHALKSETQICSVCEILKKVSIINENYLVLSSNIMNINNKFEGFISIGNDTKDGLNARIDKMNKSIEAIKNNQKEFQNSTSEMKENLGKILSILKSGFMRDY